jgi:small neutral amino acid transporter SnatA (MarC family)
LHAERALPRSRRLLAWTALVIFLLTAMPAPFAGGGFLDSIGIKIHLHQ